MEPWGWKGPEEIILFHSPASKEDFTQYTLEKWLLIFALYIIITTVLIIVITCWVLPTGRTGPSLLSLKHAWGLEATFLWAQARCVHELILPGMMPQAQLPSLIHLTVPFLSSISSHCLTIHWRPFVICPQLNFLVFSPTSPQSSPRFQQSPCHSLIMPCSLGPLNFHAHHFLQSLSYPIQHTCNQVNLHRTFVALDKS